MSRKHLAKRWWGKNGLIIRCTCGQWESRRGDTRRQQDDAHRAHRIDMGETVRPRKLTRVEQMEAEFRRLTAELQQAQQQTADRIATEIRQYCPDHGEADTCRIDCHCEIADEITRLYTPHAHPCTDPACGPCSFDRAIPPTT